MGSSHVKAHLDPQVLQLFSASALQGPPGPGSLTDRLGFWVTQKHWGSTRFLVLEFSRLGHAGPRCDELCLRGVQCLQLGESGSAASLGGAGRHHGTTSPWLHPVARGREPSGPWERHLGMSKPGALGQLTSKSGSVHHPPGWTLWDR